MNSIVDSKGRLFVDCSECKRGGNGSDLDKCSCGFKIKKPHKGGCFLGDLMDKYELEAKNKIDAATANN
jgi:hypothetical protein